MSVPAHVLVETREHPCAVCGLPVYMESRSTANKEAPEMVHVGAAWVGLSSGDAGPELIVVCARPWKDGLCIDQFFRADAPKAGA